MFKRKLITFREEEYKKELSKYKRYRFDYKHTQDKWSLLLDIDLQNVDFSKEGAFGRICELYADKWEKQNTLGLKPLKLLQVRDVDIKKLMIELDTLRTTKQTKPKKEDFEIWTTSEEQNKRLKVVSDFIKMIPYLKGAGVHFKNNMQAPILMGKPEPEPNVYFIKNTLR